MNPRIIAGIYKNRRLKVSDVTRPITDRVKTSMFDKLSEVIPDANVCDLFSGSGSIGIEALSRGAKNVVFVEESFEAISMLKDNLGAIQVPKEQYDIVKADVKTFLKQGGRTFDLIFMDPPFKLFKYFKFELLSNISSQDSVIVLKTPPDFELTSLENHFNILDTTKIGINTLVYMRIK
jgi:16S rRNA (guanine966-N2)-methyltransferase